MPYNGICFVHSALNRFEQECGKLNVSYPGENLRRLLAELGVDLDECAAIHVNDGAPPDGTRKLVLFGEEAMAMWLGESGLDAHRGHVRVLGPMEAVATYAPIDFSDVRDYETDDDDDAADAGGSGKDSSPTMRSNYRFWAHADITKLLTGVRRTTTTDDAYIVPAESMLNVLATLAGPVFFDIETHPPTNTVQCWTVAPLTGPAYTVGVYDWRGNAMGDLAALHAALAKVFARCTIVAHNASFDLPFLAHFHGIPFGRAIEDTMLNHHRCFPEAEKSLAHNISYWINAPYHKDEGGVFTPFNERQFTQLLRYNGKDVLTTRAVWRAQREYILTHQGLCASTSQVSRAIYPNLVKTLTGLKLDTARQRSHITRLEKETDVLRRIICILVGDPAFNPNSPQQVVRYLHDQMHYPVVARTEDKKPSTGGDAMYRLRINHPHNPVISAILKFRDRSKALSMLGFEKYYRPTSRS